MDKLPRISLGNESKNEFHQLLKSVAIEIEAPYCVYGMYRQNRNTEISANSCERWLFLIWTMLHVGVIIIS